MRNPMTQNETFLSGKMLGMVDAYVLAVPGAVLGPPGREPAWQQRHAPQPKPDWQPGGTEGNGISANNAAAATLLGSAAERQEAATADKPAPTSPRTRIACLRLSGTLVYLYLGELELVPVRLPGVALRFVRQYCRNCCNCNRCQAPTASEQ